MPQPLEEISDAAMMESGIWPSVDVLKAPLWISGQNVDFRKGQVEKARGWSTKTTSLTPVNALAQALVDDKKRIYLAGEDTLRYFVENEDTYDIRTTGLSAGGFWSLIAWGRFLLASNGIDRVQYWPNSGLAVDLTDGPTKASLIRALLVYIVALNVNGEEGRVAWCSGGNPLVWTPTLENDAGGFYIRNVSSPLTACEALGASLIAFTQTQPYQISFVGGNNVITYSDMQLRVGALGKNCVSSDGTSLFGLDRRGFWQTDGVSVRWLADPAIWDYFKERIDFDRGDEVVAYYNRLRATIEWHWKTTENVSEGWAYSLTNNQWAPRSYGLTAAIDDAVFTKPIGADGADVRLLGDGVNAGAGVALASSIQTKPLAIKSLDSYKWLDEIRLRQAGVGLVEVGMSEEPEGVIEWLPAEALAERVFPHREAAFFHLRFSSTGVGDDWSVAGMEFYGKYCGGRIGR